MGSPPLAALSIRPPENPVDQYARIAQIRALINGQQLSAQELQQKQIQTQSMQMALQGQQALRAAEQDPNWDPRDLDKSLGIMQKYSVPTDVAKNVLTGISQIREGLSNASTENLKTVQDSQGFMDDQFQSVKAAPDDQKQNAYSQAIQGVKQHATMLPEGPGKQQILQEIQNIPAVYDQSWVNEQHARLRSMQYLTEEALNNAKTREASSKAAQSEAEAAKVTGEGNPSSPFYSPTPAYLQNQAAGGPNVDANAQAGAQNILAGQAKQAGAVAGAEAKAKLPYEVEARKQAAIAAVQAQAQMYAGNSALAKVPPHLVPAATSEATKLGTDYATLSGQLANLRSQLAAAKTGDEVAAAFAPVATALGSNSFYGTHRLAPAEVSALGPQLGSVGRQINTWFDKATKGQLPDASLREFGGLVDRLSDAAESKYRNGLAVVNQNYGAAFQPVQMSTSGGTGQVQVKDPQGGIHTFSDQASADKFKKLAGIQ